MQGTDVNVLFNVALMNHLWDSRRRFYFPFVLCSYLGRSTSGFDVCRGEKGGEEMTAEEGKKRVNTSN